MPIAVIIGVVTGQFHGASSTIKCMSQFTILHIKSDEITVTIISRVKQDAVGVCRLKVHAELVPEDKV